MFEKNCDELKKGDDDKMKRENKTMDILSKIAVKILDFITFGATKVALTKIKYDKNINKK